MEAWLESRDLVILAVGVNACEWADKHRCAQSSHARTPRVTAAGVLAVPRVLSSACRWPSGRSGDRVTLLGRS